MMRELIFDDHVTVKRKPRKQAAQRSRRAIGHVIATANKTGRVFKLPYYSGMNSFGEPGAFLGVPKQKEFAGLRGYPLYATQTWLVANGYRYEVT